MAPATSTSARRGVSVDREMVNPSLIYAVRISMSMLISLSILYVSLYQLNFRRRRQRTSRVSRMSIGLSTAGLAGMRWTARSTKFIWCIPWLDNKSTEYVDFLYQPFHQVLIAGATMTGPVAPAPSTSISTHTRRNARSLDCIDIITNVPAKSIDDDDDDWDSIYVGSKAVTLYSVFLQFSSLSVCIYKKMHDYFLPSTWIVTHPTMSSMHRDWFLLRRWLSMKSPRTTSHASHG